MFWIGCDCSDIPVVSIFKDSNRITQHFVVIQSPQRKQIESYGCLHKCRRTGCLHSFTGWISHYMRKTIQLLGYIPFMETLHMGSFATKAAHGRTAITAEWRSRRRWPTHQAWRRWLGTRPQLQRRKKCCKGPRKWSREGSQGLKMVKPNQRVLSDRTMWFYCGGTMQTVEYVNV